MAARLRGLGMTLLGIWLLLEGLVSIVNLHFTGLGILLGILALVAGILILLGR